MNFPMFSGSHFLSNGKQSTKSEGAGERETDEGLDVAKPRSACLVSRKHPSEKQISPLDSSASHVLGTRELDSVFASTRKPARDKFQNPATVSQLCPKDDNPRHRDTCARWREPTCKDKVGLP